MSWDGRKRICFCTLRERRAYVLTSILRNMGYNPLLEFGRSPGANFIYRSTVKVEIESWAYDKAMGEMYEHTRPIEEREERA